MATVYLAGAIDKNREKACREWRDLVSKELREVGINIINPIEGKELDKDYSAEEIVKEDIESIDRSNIVLAEVGIISPEYPYVGTSMEIMYSYMTNTPVYCWTNLSNNLFLDYHVDYKSPTLIQIVYEIKKEVLNLHEIRPLV